MGLFTVFEGAAKAITTKGKALLFLYLVASAVNAADCHSSELWRYTATATGNTLMLDFRGMSNYVYANLTNVRINSVQTGNRYDNYRLILDTTTTKAVNVSIMDSLDLRTYTTVTTTPDDLRVLLPADLEEVNKAYRVYFRDEADGLKLRYQNYTTLTAYFFCTDNAPYTYNLKSLGANNITLGMTSKPYIQVEGTYSHSTTSSSNTPYVTGYTFTQQGLTNNRTTGSQTYIYANTTTSATVTTVSNFTRTRQMLSDYDTTNYLVPNLFTNTLVKINFQLQDYTGDYQNSYLRIQYPYSGSYQDIFTKEWDSANNNNDIYLIRDRYYRILVETDGKTIDKGLVKFTADGTQVIAITEPILSNEANPYEGVQLSLYSNTTTYKLYCYYNVDNISAFTGSYFSVTNSSGNNVYLSQNFTTATGTFQFAPTNKNDTYKVVCAVNFNGITFSKTNYLGFTGRRYYPSFSGTPLGWTIAEYFTGVVLFLIIFIMGFASQINASYISLFGIGALWLFNYWEWITISPILMSFMLVLAVLYRLKQSQKGVG